MQEQNPIVLMNFSGIYREEEFWKNRQVSWIELQKIIQLPESILLIPAIITI